MRSFVPAAVAARLPESTLASIPRTWADVAVSEEWLRRLLNVWPPYLAAGVRVTQLLPGWRGATVVLRLRPWNANYVGTTFGGSLFAMSDPFWMLLVANRLGPEYVVWDARAEIDFVAPGRGDVRTTFDVPDSLVDELRAAAADGSKVLRWLENEVVDREGRLVARVRKELYVRRKPARTDAG